MTNSEPWDEMKALLKACGLTYEQAASLVGASVQTMRSWLKKSGYTVPPATLAFFRWLAGQKPEFRKHGVTEVSLMTRMSEGNVVTLPAETDKVAKLGAQVATARQRHIDREMSLARHLIAASTPLGVAKILSCCKPLESTVAYEWREGALIVALVTSPHDGKISVALLRDVIIPGYAWTEAPEVEYTFDPMVCGAAVDDASAKTALMDCLWIGGTQGLGSAFAPLVHALLVAHVIAEGVEHAA